MKQTHRNLLIGSILIGSALTAGSVTIPNSFTANTTAKASEVNANFSAVKSAVDGNAGDIATNKSNITANANDIASGKSTVETNSNNIQTNANDIARGGAAVTAPAGYNVIYKGGRAWLDRNVGATSAPTSWNDTTQTSLGSLFQWGRKADGHQYRDIASGDNSADVRATTASNTASTICAPGDIIGNNKFIIGANASGGYNWRTTAINCNTDAERTNLWSSPGNQMNGVCPAGWRVPSEQDFAALDIAIAADAFSKIKLSAAGYRSASSGSILQAGTYGRYWTSSISGSKSVYLFIGATQSYVGRSTGYRANGYSVRCVKHLNN